MMLGGYRDQIAGVGDARFGGFGGAQHPRNFRFAFNFAKRLYPGLGVPSNDGFTDDEMLIAGAGDLWRMRDTNDLAMAGDVTQIAPDDVCRSAPYPRIDLVIDHDRDTGVTRGCSLDGQAYARQFTAGGNLVERPGWLAGIRGKDELDSIEAVGEGDGVTCDLQRNGELGVWNTEISQAASDVLLHPAGGCGAPFAQQRSGFDIC